MVKCTSGNQGHWMEACEAFWLRVETHFRPCVVLTGVVDRLKLVYCLAAGTRGREIKVRDP